MKLFYLILSYHILSYPNISYSILSYPFPVPIQRRLQGGGEWAAAPPDALRGGHRPPLGPQKERFVPLFPVQENNITNTIFFILIRFRLKELKRNKKGQNIVQVEGAKNFSRPSGAKFCS